MYLRKQLVCIYQIQTPSKGDIFISSLTPKHLY